MDTNKAGKGFIIRNGKGEVMATLAEKISMASLVEFVEAIANHYSFFFFFWVDKTRKTRESNHTVNVYYVLLWALGPTAFFTCIAHLYLYYTLLVPHTYASYIRH